MSEYVLSRIIAQLRRGYMSICRGLGLVLGVIIIASGISLSCSTPKVAPQITDKMSTEKIVSIALDYGGVSLNVAKDKITKRGVEEGVATILEKELLEKQDSLSEKRLANGVNLYQYTKKGASYELVRTMIYSNRSMSNDLGWMMASNFPSEQMKNLVEEYITKKIESGNEESLLKPFIASAIKSNNVVSVYSVARLGLMQADDNLIFAEACATLKPKEASTDFLAYLSRANLDDLRQLNQRSINMQTAAFALRHMQKYPPQVSDPNVDVLFLYSLSRNNALSENAYDLLNKLYGDYMEVLSLKLSRLSEWIQICFVEQMREKINTTTRRFLLSLQTNTPYPTVFDEIKDLKL